MANEKQATLLIKIKEQGSSILDSIMSKFGSLQAIAVAAFTAISAVIVNALDQYREQEQAVNSLSAAMVNAGIFTSELKNRYIEMADALSKVTAFGDEEIITAQAILQQHLGNIEVTKELTQATLDLAAKTGSLESAADMVGKTIGSTTNALARQGIEVDNNASKQEKLSQVIDGLNSKVKGQAAAQVDGLGVWSLVSKAIGEVSEKFGEQLAPAFTAAGQKALEFVNLYLAPTAQFIGGAFTKLVDVIGLVMMVVGNAFETVGTQIGNVAGFIGEVIGAITDRDFKRLKNAAVTFGESMVKSFTEPIERDLPKYQSLWGDLVGSAEMARQKDLANAEAAAAKKAEIARKEEQDAAIAKQEEMIAAQVRENELIGANDQQKLDAQLRYLDEKIKQETDAEAKLQLLKDKSHLLNEQRALKEKELEKKKNDELVKNRADTLNTISTLQTSNNKFLAAAGKAAGITQIAIDTPVAVSKALAAFPPPFNFAAAGLVAAAMAAQAAKIAGVPLAEGGIVRATPGGIQATIGEGGRDEAVIPLDSQEAQGRLGGQTTIIFNGPVLGDENQAMEFARAIDRSLLKLRQSNQSVAFETDLI